MTQSVTDSSLRAVRVARLAVRVLAPRLLAAGVLALLLLLLLMPTPGGGKVACWALDVPAAAAAVSGHLSSFRERLVRLLSWLYGSCSSGILQALSGVLIQASAARIRLSYRAAMLTASTPCAVVVSQGPSAEHLRCVQAGSSILRVERTAAACQAVLTLAHASRRCCRFTCCSTMASSAGGRGVPVSRSSAACGSTAQEPFSDSLMAHPAPL